MPAYCKPCLQQIIESVIITGRRTETNIIERKLIWQAEIHGTDRQAIGDPQQIHEADPVVLPEAAAGITAMTGAAVITVTAVMAAVAVTAVPEAEVRPAFPSK